MPIEFSLDNALREIKKRKAKLVLVQLPEGLKTRADEILQEIEQCTSAKAVLHAEPCFGACDLAEADAKALGADLVLHMGHARIPNIKSALTIFVPVRYGVGKKTLENVAQKIKKQKFGKVALCATVQYVHILPLLRKALARADVKAFIGKGGARIAEKGQVLGCDCSAVRAVEERADAIVFVGDGMFHPLGIYYGMKKSMPVLLVNPEGKVTVKALAQERDKFIRQRFGAIARAKSAGKFGIIMSSKAGQARRALALRTRELLEAKGRKAILLSAGHVREDYFAGMGIDCFVSTACPRLALDDGLNWKKPVITFPELEIVLGKRAPEKYEFDMLG
ncbi:MAG: diphthamide biosynthesis enzyme Dph2 [Candidatus Diapherotrites archaeon]